MDKYKLIRTIEYNYSRCEVGLKNSTQLHEGKYKKEGAKCSVPFKVSDLKIFMKRRRVRGKNTENNFMKYAK